MRGKFLFTKMAMVLMVGSAFAAPMTYQGQLQDSNNPYTGSVEMDFRLYQSETGGGAIDVRTEIVNVSGGVFQVELDFGDQPYEDGLWLGVSVDGELLEPRQRISASPLAIRTLDGGFWSDRGDGVIGYTDGTVAVTPNEHGDISEARFIVQGGVNQPPMVIRGSGGAPAMRVNQNRSVSIGTNWGATSIPDHGLRVVGPTILDSGLQVEDSVTIGGWDQDSRLGVGTDNPWNTLHVVANEDQGPFRFSQGTSDGIVMRGHGNRGVSIGGSYSTSVVPDNGLRVAGQVRVGNFAASTSINLCRTTNGILANCTSSIRYKDDIEPLELDVDLLAELQPVRYRWIDSNEFDVGLIAEEVATVFPELVYRDDEGRIEGIVQSRLMAVVIAAYQDLKRQTGAALADLAAENAELRQLAERNVELEDRLARLEALLVDGTAQLAEVSP